MHLLIMGAPGSGKGTCAVELKQFYGIPHISTGDIFRQAIADKTPLGLVAKELIEQGHFVPDDLTNQIVKERLSMDDCKKGFLLDGYPRNLEQAKYLSEMLNNLNIKLDAAINLDIDDQVIVNRIVNRRLCPNCKKGYNLISLPPKKPGVCDDCNSLLYQRKDDNEETIKERIAVYNEQTKPIISYYEKLGILKTINADQQIPQVIEDIKEMVK